MSENDAAVMDTAKRGTPLGDRIEFMNKNNDGNRTVIHQMYETEGAAFLGKINLGKGWNTGDILVLYKGQCVYNSEFDFCIPAFDRLIVEFIEEWNTKHQYPALKAIFKRIEILRGCVLSWM